MIERTRAQSWKNGAKNIYTAGKTIRKLLLKVWCATWKRTQSDSYSHIIVPYDWMHEKTWLTGVLNMDVNARNLAFQRRINFSFNPCTQLRLIIILCGCYWPRGRGVRGYDWRGEGWRGEGGGKVTLKHPVHTETVIK